MKTFDSKYIRIGAGKEAVGSNTFPRAGQPCVSSSYASTHFSIVHFINIFIFRSVIIQISESKL